MHLLEKTLTEIAQQPIAILDAKIPVRGYTPIDLSTHNPDLKSKAYLKTKIGLVRKVRNYSWKTPLRFICK